MTGEGVKTVSKTHAGQLRHCGLPPSTGNRYSYTKHLVWGSGTHTVSHSMPIRGYILAIKQLGHITKHTSPYSAKVNNAWSCTSTPPSIRLCGIYRDNFTKSKENRITLKNIYVPGFTTVGVLLDVVVWWLGRGLGLYEETNTSVSTCSRDDGKQQLKR